MYERKVLLGFMRVHILYHAHEEGTYGAEMIEELESHGYSISPGTIYPIFHEMEEKGLLKSEKKEIDGKVIKFYRSTPEGAETLDHLREFISELHEEVMP